MKIVECINCESEFDLHGILKQRSGGKINVCPLCTEEDVPKYVGLQAADGKQSQIQILAFDDAKDKDKYLHFWQNNTGLFRAKSCNLGSHLSTTPDVKFRSINTFNATNHKGKA